MSLASMLRTTVTHQRNTTTKDASGGEVASFATVTADIPCDIQPASSNTVFRYSQKNILVSHSIYLAADISPKGQDQFISGSRVFMFRGYRPPAPGYGYWPAVVDVEELLL